MSVEEVKQPDIANDVEKTPTEDGTVVLEMSKDDARRLLRKID